MPSPTANSPAFLQWLAALPMPSIWGQVRISTQGSSGPRSFELRHISDGSLPSESLTLTPLAQLRPLGMHTADGKFRPIKSAPSLRSGWRAVAQDSTQLELAIDALYPGSVADWAAIQRPEFIVGTFREFTGRQTGMYRITQLLDDAQAAQAITACCEPAFCLKNRRWTVKGLPADETSSGKSLIPCLEPCAIMLEFARKAIKIDKEEKISVSLAPSELSTLKEALEHLRDQPAEDLREGDVGAAANPRRIQLLLAKLGAVSTPLADKSPE